MDQFAALRAFTAVVETGSFAAAGRRLGVATSSVTRQVDALEDRLGARLFNRSTRAVTPTNAGHAYYEHAARILSDLEEADHAVARLDEQPRGPLRVSAPLAFGRLHVAPMVAGYLARFPAVQLDLNLSDTLVNLVEENVDIAIRVADLQDSPALISRRIAANRRVICASPQYLERHGEPRTPADLAAHNCLCYARGPQRIVWQFRHEGGVLEQPVDGSLRSNNAETLVEAALGGAGIVLLPTWIVGAHLRSGRLRAVLTDYRYGRTGQHFAVGDIFAVYLTNRSGSPKVKSFIDALIEHVGTEPYWDLGQSLRNTQ